MPPRPEVTRTRPLKSSEPRYLRPAFSTVSYTGKHKETDQKQELQHTGNVYTKCYDFKQWFPTFLTRDLLMQSVLVTTPQIVSIYSCKEVKLSSISPRKKTREMSKKNKQYFVWRICFFFLFLTHNHLVTLILRPLDGGSWPSGWVALIKRNPYFCTRRYWSAACCIFIKTFTNHSAMNNPLRSNVAVAACCHLTVPENGQTKEHRLHQHICTHMASFSS